MLANTEIERSPEDREAKFTGSQINYYFICKRKLWLFSHNIELEPESDLVKLGKLLHENRYKRKMKEVQIDRIKVDFMESKKIAKEAPVQLEIKPNELHNSSSEPGKNETSKMTSADSFISEEVHPQSHIVIHEIKRSKKMQDAHLFQLLYYMYYLKKNHGVNIQKGVLHYPLLKQNVDVLLTDDKVKQIEEAISGIEQVNAMINPPEATWKGYCRSCAYGDLCWG